MDPQSSQQASGSKNSDASPKSGTNVDQAALALKADVKQGAHDVADKAKGVASDLATGARDSIEQKLSSGKSRAVEGLEQVADALRQTGEHLQSQDGASLTRYVSRAAEQVEAVSGYLDRKNPSEVLADVQRFARREPAMFLGAAFVVGLLGGRFLKSSTPSRAGAESNDGPRTLAVPKTRPSNGIA